MRRNKARSRRRTPLIWLGLIFVLFSTVWAVTMAAFNAGFMQGAATAGAVLVVYSVPATLFDWPRITLTDAFDLLAGIVGGIAEFFRSLFGL